MQYTETVTIIPSQPPSTPDAGLLNVYKPTGVTSFRMVALIKRMLTVKKVGHCGTLDPLAEGVLLILFGPATKLQSLCMGLPKVYRVRLRLGVTTDTGDITGAVLEEKTVPALSPEVLAPVLERFTGTQEQVPPMYSALKYGGRKLYELAREGRTVERAPRRITVYALDFLGLRENSLELRVHCSRGTYVRTLGEDIGRALGCGATVEYLCREKVGPFDAAAAVDETALRSLSREELLNKSHSIEALKGILKI